MRNAVKMLVVVLGGCLLGPAAARAQIPGVQIPKAGQVTVPTLPSKADLTAQARQMVTDLTTLKSSGKLTPDQTAKVDALVPKANTISTALQQSSVETSKLAKLAKDLSDVQKEVGALKAMVK
jgi:hypothetical protein